MISLEKLTEYEALSSWMSSTRFIHLYPSWLLNWIASRAVKRAMRKYSRYYLALSAIKKSEESPIEKVQD